MPPKNWRTCSLTRLLEALGGKLGDRKWRLLACAAVRRLRQLSSAAQQAVAVAERFADGRATAHELAAARFAGRFTPGHPAWAVCWGPDADGQAMAVRALSWVAGLSGDSLSCNEPDAQADLVREVAAHRFRPVHVDPLWRAASDGAVVRLARGIYEDQDFAQMPILGDALEEAGCTDAEVLDHCRRGGHVRGCWLLDLLLEKE
jgi:hypothetical protein